MSTGETLAFPLFLRLDGRRVVVVGGGFVALQKATALHEHGARVRVVAIEAREGVSEVADEVVLRAFEPHDLDDAWVVVSAATPEVNRAVKIAADARRLFVVAVDDVESCSAIGAASLRRGDITIAISSDGVAPALVALLRRAIDRILPLEIDAWVQLARAARPLWKQAQIPIEARRPLLLAALNGLYSQGREVA